MSNTNLDQIKETLDTHLETVRRRYDAFNDTERLAVNGIVVLVTIVLVFLLIISPAQKSVSQAEMKLNGKQSLLTWMQENESLARKASGKSNRSASNRPLQAVVTSSAPQMGVTLKRFEPESDNKLRVWIEKVPFNKTVRWLNQLENRYGVKIVNVSVDADREVGLVTAKLVLQK